MPNKIKPIAIYLPQFHPIPENDEWWGKGFTEWTNVVKAKPRFEGHYQPHLPADLGFYDLRLEETRLAQEAMAKEYGIYGFCYYHYWFNGKRMLHEPLDRKLKNPQEDLPFMMCWANENWTKTWDGLDKEVLLHQEYGFEDDVIHFEFLCKNYFNDERYIKHEGKPVFLVYRPKLFNDINKTIEIWRNIARKEGVGEVHLGYMQSWGIVDDPIKMGFDFAVEFQPHFPGKQPNKRTIGQKIITKIYKQFNLKENVVITQEDRVFDYNKFVEIQKKNVFKSNVSPCLIPMWDNSSRRKSNSFIFTNSTPRIYGEWLNHIVNNFPWNVNKENFLFINAWNEWAEGNHLEPCQKWGRKYLEATKENLISNEK
ncbi:glycoside hydrolase family 99-like domain-containing protein [Flavobacterium sp. 11]|uniref:glycosyltransferase WbsX family protein n=1 Tax=Flavobacterium sp. 11 TaxID=357523 RepID=UPI000C197945|nr:glycoside hydrolase family 99-like domain-containing protein [Flavobacterium sp. 11]PIF60610.1 glycosyl transferase family WbsX [Flavobacterium sp. 11]